MVRIGGNVIRITLRDAHLCVSKKLSSIVADARLDAAIVLTRRLGLLTRRARRTIGVI
jgi:hypothetical protein